MVAGSGFTFKKKMVGGQVLVTLPQTSTTTKPGRPTTAKAWLPAKEGEEGIFIFIFIKCRSSMRSDDLV